MKKKGRRLLKKKKISKKTKKRDATSLWPAVESRDDYFDVSKEFQSPPGTVNLVTLHTSKRGGVWSIDILNLPKTARIGGPEHQFFINVAVQGDASDVITAVDWLAQNKKKLAKQASGIDRYTGLSHTKKKKGRKAIRGRR